jgi:hypothetical protein
MIGQSIECRGWAVADALGYRYMAMLAIAMFIALFAFGKQIFGWHDADGDIQLAMVASFLFGVIAAFRNRG